MHSHKNQDLVEQYRKAGFLGRVGWGTRPAVLVIDMAQAWTDPEEQLGAEVEKVISATVEVLDVARASDRIPIYFTTMAFDEELREIGVPFRRKMETDEPMIRGSDRTKILEVLDRQPDEILIEKPRASAFFGTNLLSMLISDRVDTLIIVGLSTSGCIRATCESAINYGFHAIVPAEAVGDRSSTAHEASLFDIDARMADVCPISDVIDNLKQIGVRD